MADTKISDLTAATALAGTEPLAVVQSATTKKATLSQVLTYVNTNFTAAGIGDAATTRTNLGVAIGTNVQAYDAGLQSLAALVTSADKGVYTTALDVYATYSLTAGGRALGGVAGTADTYPYFSALNTVTLGSITAAGRSMLSAASAAAQIALLPSPYDIVVAISDETTAITTGTAKVTIRAPRAMTLSNVLASLNTVSSSGTPTFDINVNGATILSTKLTIDASEKTSATAAVPAVISSSAIALDDEITFDIDVAGTGAKGAKIVLKGTAP